MRNLQLATFAVMMGFIGCASDSQVDAADDFEVAQDALTTRIQAETQVWTASSGDSTTASSSTLRLNANAAADSFKFTSTVATGSYAVTLRYSQRNVYGNYQIYVNGTSVGTISGYSTNTSDTWSTVSLGTLALSGSVEFKFVSTGKNSASSDFDIKLDYLDLTTTTTGTGGSSSAGGATAKGGTSATGGTSSSSYACDGTTTGYNATMIKSGSTWVVTAGGSQRYSGTDTQTALVAAYNSLTAGRTTKQSILVQGNGDIAATSLVQMPSYLVLNWCGTLNVSGTPASSGDQSPLRASNKTDIEIPNLKMTGSPAYGLFFRGTNNITLGNIDLRLSSAAGIGIRVDTSGSAGSDTTFVTNLKINRVYGSGMGSHIVETYGVSNITIGTVEGDSVGECGLLLNRSIHAEVTSVSCNNCGTGTGYAAFRIANSAGLINGSYPAGNLHVGKVYARGGGRGVFSVSASGGLTIDTVDIASTGSNPILLENATNTTIAAKSGTISGGQVRLAGTTQSNLSLRNLTLSNGANVLQSPCPSPNTCTATGVTGGTVSMCN